MLTSIVVTPDVSQAVGFRETFSRCRHLRLDSIVTRALEEMEFLRLVKLMEPDLVFLDFADPKPASGLAACLAANLPQVGCVGLRGRGQQPGPADGVEWLEWPAPESEVDDAARRALHRASGNQGYSLFAFVPAKSGSGASTVALHVSNALANQLGRRTLLLDSDLRSGVVAIYLNLDLRKATRDALAHAASLQPLEWQDLVVPLGKLDVLGNRAEQGGRLPVWTDYYKLLQFAMPKYDAVVVDLPELTNEATSEIVRQARRVFVVTTAELPALKLACLRFRQLTAAGAEDSKLALVLNRWHKSDLPPKEVGKILGRPVVATLPNDYRSTQRAMLAGGFVHQETVLGRAYLEFSSRLWKVREPELKPAPAHSRFLELIGVS